MVKEEKELDSMGKEIDKELNEIKKKQLKETKIKDQKTTTNKSKEKKDKKKETKKEKNKVKTTSFKNEIKKIHWPSKKDMVKYSVATVVFTIFMAGFCFGITALFAELINLIGA